MRLISSPLLCSSILGLLIAAGPLTINAQTAPPPIRDSASKATTDAPTAKARPIPFRGKLTSVDKIGQTITVGARIFRITPETKLYRGASKLPARLSDAVTGEQITGSYIKEADGRLIARSVYFATRAPSKEAEEKKAEEKKGKSTTKSKQPTP